MGDDDGKSGSANNNQWKKKKRKLAQSNLTSSSPSSKTTTKNSSGIELQQVKKQLASQRAKLPVYPFKKEICDLVSQKEVLLVVAETGSGVSFFLPSFPLVLFCC